MKNSTKTEAQSMLSLSSSGKSKTRPPKSDMISLSKKHHSSPNSARERLMNQKDLSLIDQSEDDIFFDSISLHFSIFIFFKQFFIHMRCPLLMFFTNAINQDFLTVTINAVLFHYIFPVCFYAMFVSAFMGLGTSLEDNGPLWLPVMYYTLHKCLVASKYACLSPSEYRKFMASSYTKSQQYQSQQMLRSGWFSQPLPLVEFEMSAAAMRCGVDLSHLFFSIPNPADSEDSLSQYRSWKAFLLGKDYTSDDEKCVDLLPQVDGTYKISVFKLGIAIIRYGDKMNEARSVSSYGLFFVTIANLAIPLLLLLAPANKNIAYDYWVIIFYCTSSVINLIFGSLILDFLRGVLYDALRSKKAMMCIRKLIRVSDFESDGRFVRIGEKQSSKREMKLLSEKENVNHFLERVVSGGHGGIMNTSQSSASDNGDVTRDYTETEQSIDSRVEEGGSGSGATYSIDNINGNKSSSCTSLLDEEDDDDVVRNMLLSGDSSPRNIHSNNNNHQHKKGLHYSTSATIASALNRQPSNNVRETKPSEVIGALQVQDEDITYLPRLRVRSGFEYNIVAWTYTRLMLQRYGSRFKFRLDVFVGILSAVVTTYTVAALILVFTNLNGNDLAYRSFFLQSLLAMVVLACLLISLSFQGSRCNMELIDHKESIGAQMLKIVRRKVLLEKRLYDGGFFFNGDVALIQAAKEQLESLERVHKHLESCLAVLEVNNNTAPYVLLGMATSPALTSTLIGATITFVGVVFAAYAPNRNNTIGGGF